MSAEASSDLAKKVSDWLSKQGHPLEFFVANELWKAGVAAQQGSFITDLTTKSPREIDVAAQISSHFEDYLLRVEFVIECKWSRNKPWVLFTSPHTGLNPVARVSQTIGSLLGFHAMALRAHEKRLQDLELYSIPKRGAFGGRQVFSDQKDPVYSALQSITSAAVARVFDYDPEFFSKKPRRYAESGLPRSAVLVFPIVVVDGVLFEAFAEKDGESLRVSEIEGTQVFWEGSPAWPLVSTIHVVTKKAFSSLANSLQSNAEVIFSALTESLQAMHEWLKSRDPAVLGIRPDPRGHIGIPNILLDAAKKKAQEKTKSDPRDNE